MAQAAFAFDTPVVGISPRHQADEFSGYARTAFDIGWDHAHHRLTPPVAHLHASHPVRQGWDAGRAAYGRRTLAATPAVRQWLALRLQALVQGVAFEAVAVTPHHLARLAASHCPVTRQPLTAAHSGITRLRPDAGYAAGHLVMLGSTAGRACNTTLAADALATAQRLAASGGQAQGLGAAEWLRLAVLKACVTPLPHAQAAMLPLAALPTPRLRLLNPAQALQALLLLQFTRPGYAKRLPALAELVPAGEQRQALQVFVHTLLARRLASGVDETNALAVRQQLEDAWAEPLLLQRWQRLALRLPAEQCERIVLHAAQRGLARGGWRWLAPAQATDGWASDDTLPLVRPLPTAPAAQAPHRLPAMPLPRPMPTPQVPAH